ncbi:MAG: ATP-binding protein [Candidatus Hydrogenedentota bacterium]
MDELIVISGKGGTGKTSITASFAALADNAVIVDCDVDAADMHLLLQPEVAERHTFRSGHEAVIRPADCIGCGICMDYCRFEAITQQTGEEGRVTCAVDPVACEGCGVCVRVCPRDAIDFPECECGEWMISDTRSGPLVHARLGVAAENSGKLVALVRTEARRLAEAKHCKQIIVDGPPGIGCPVIASVTGATRVLVITEPSVSGEHDLERVLALTKHFKIATAVCVNKWDLNPAMTERIEKQAAAQDAQIVGRIPYDPGVTGAQMEGRAVVETGSTAAQAVRAIWRELDNQTESTRRLADAP